MKGKKKFHTKPYHYSTIHNNHPSSDNILSVNERLTKLRVEHNRAITNRQRHASSSLTGQTVNTQRIDYIAPRERQGRRLPGTTHRFSWNLQPHPTNLPSTITSLVTKCCQQLAHDAKRAEKTIHLPPHLKQHLLHEWGSSITDTTLSLFERTEYEQLWLESAHISLERLVQGFWRVEKPKQDELEEDWETLLLDDLPWIHIDPDQEEIGKWKHLYQIISLLSSPPTHTLLLSSPYLGRTLVSLNISHVVPTGSLSWLTFAYLIVDTLPGLKWLYSAGIFNATEGPVVLGILARGLRQLTLWDLTDHSWLCFDPLIEKIHWDSDLRLLTTLCLSPIDADEVGRWFRQNKLSRIKLVWGDVA